MNRVEVLQIYRDSTLHENTVKALFDKIMDLSGTADKPNSGSTILIPDCNDATIVKILVCCGYSLDKIYVTEVDKARRAALHRQRVKIIDDRGIADIDIFNTCGKYRKHPGCEGCDVDNTQCKYHDVKFDTAIVLHEYTTLQKHVENVIIIPGGTV